MARKTCFIFDMDGTLIHDYLQDGPNGLEPDPAHPYTEPSLRLGVYEKLRDMSLEIPFVVFGIATNQAGAALGYCTEAETNERIVKTIQLTKHMGGLSRPFTVQTCLHHPDATVEPWASERTEENLSRRKPRGGMITDAMRMLAAEADETVYVGDRDSDRLAAEDAGVAFEWAQDFFPQGDPA